MTNGPVHVEPRTRSLTGVQILGTGSYLPENVVSNFDLRETHGFDPEWAQTDAPVPDASPKPRAAAPIPPAADVEIPPFPAPVVEHDDADPDMLLTEVASDDDLFSDPSLEIAHLASGEAREIIVPVMLGEGKNARRYKLAIRLRLDPVD